MYIYIRKLKYIKYNVEISICKKKCVNLQMVPDSRQQKHRTTMQNSGFKPSQAIGMNFPQILGKELFHCLKALATKMIPRTPFPDPPSMEYEPCKQVRQHIVLATHSRPSLVNGMMSSAGRWGCLLPESPMSMIGIK